MTDLENYLKAENEQLHEQLSVALQQAALDQVAFDQSTEAFDKLVEAFDQLSVSHDRVVEAFNQVSASNDQLRLELDQMTLKSKRGFFWNK